MSRPSRWIFISYTPTVFLACFQVVCQSQWELPSNLSSSNLPSPEVACTARYPCRRRSMRNATFPLISGAGWKRFDARKCRSTRWSTNRQPLTFRDAEQLRLGFRGCCPSVYVLAVQYSTMLHPHLKSPFFAKGSRSGLAEHDPEQILRHSSSDLALAPHSNSARSRRESRMTSVTRVSRGAASCAYLKELV